MLGSREWGARAGGWVARVMAGCQGMGCLGWERGRLWVRGVSVIEGLSARMGGDAREYSARTWGMPGIGVSG